MKLVAFRIPEQLWSDFYRKYRKNSHQRIRELIVEDLKND